MYSCISLSATSLPEILKQLSLDVEVDNVYVQCLTYELDSQHPWWKLQFVCTHVFIRCKLDLKGPVFCSVNLHVPDKNERRMSRKTCYICIQSSVSGPVALVRRVSTSTRLYTDGPFQILASQANRLRSRWAVLSSNLSTVLSTIAVGDHDRRLHGYSRFCDLVHDDRSRRTCMVWTVFSRESRCTQLVLLSWLSDMDVYILQTRSWTIAWVLRCRRVNLACPVSREPDQPNWCLHSTFSDHLIFIASHNMNPVQTENEDGSADLFLWKWCLLFWTWFWWRVLMS